MNPDQRLFAVGTLSVDVTGRTLVLKSPGRTLVSFHEMARNTGESTEMYKVSQTLHNYTGIGKYIYIMGSGGRRGRVY